MKHYFGVYKMFMSTSIAVETSFRTSFVLLVFMDAFFFATSLGSLNIIFNHIDTIGPWNKDQFSFFLCFMLMLDNLHMMMFSQSFWELSSDIKTGQLDYTILRPLNIIFSIFFRHFRISSLFNTPLYAGFLIYFGMRCDLTILSWSLLPLLLLMSLALYVSIEFILSALMFWTTDGNGINFLRMQLQQVARWPNHIYVGYMKKIFTVVIPVLVVGSYPSTFLLNNSKFELMILFLIILLLSIFIANLVWTYAVRRYESASS